MQLLLLSLLQRSEASAAPSYLWGPARRGSSIVSGSTGHVTKTAAGDIVLVSFGSSEEWGRTVAPLRVPITSNGEYYHGLKSVASRNGLVMVPVHDVYSVFVLGLLWCEAAWILGVRLALYDDAFACLNVRY